MLAANLAMYLAAEKRDGQIFDEGAEEERKTAWSSQVFSEKQERGLHVNEASKKANNKDCYKSAESQIRNGTEIGRWSRKQTFPFPH